MAKRKPDPTSANQLDMFGTLGPEPATSVAVPAVQEAEPAKPAPANDSQAVIVAAAESDPCDTTVQGADTAIPAEPTHPPKPSRPATVITTTGWVDDEWWTLAMVCAYLKLGRKAVWERKRDPKLGFPQPVCLGSSRPRWRGNEVREWAGAQT